MTFTRLPAVVLAALLLGGCVTPARNASQYDAKARAALSASESELGTTLLAVRQVQRGLALRAYADEVVTSSEGSLGAIQDSFGSVQPPDPASDAVRDDVSAALQAAGDAVAHARIAVRRPGTAQLAPAVSELLDARAGVEQALAGLR